MKWYTTDQETYNYQIGETDYGKWLRSKISYRDEADFEYQLYTPSIYVPVPELPAPTINTGSALFVLKEEPIIGENLEIQQVENDPEGNGNYDIAWQRSLADGSWNFVEQSGVFYNLSDLDSGQQIRAIASYVDEQGFSEVVTTEPIDIPANLPVNPNPKEDLGNATFDVSGTPILNELLEVIQTTNDPDGNGLPTYSWQYSQEGLNWYTTENKSHSYKISDYDYGKWLRSKVGYKDEEGFEYQLFTPNIYIPYPRGSCTIG